MAGSRKFLRLIKERNYAEALAIARKQVEDGAMMLDVNMDDAMLDATTQMREFVNLMASDLDVARVPWMIDSSNFDVITAALKAIQGKAVVNSLSLKEGEQLFVERARIVRSFGAAIVVMAFDEQGQATTFERKIEICSRAYRLLTEQAGFEARDIIFDPNILTVATGMAEHDRYAADFILATEWIAKNLPQTHISGGVSNLSFAFRGNNFLREAMHAVFLYHASKVGMDMAIVNPSTAVMYEQIPPQLLEAIEDVILARRADATERLLAIAADFSQQVETAEQTAEDNRTLEQRLISALERGDESHLEADLMQALEQYGSAAKVIEQPLMQGMIRVGELFGQGKMFLPQVVKTARTMKHAVAILQPYMGAAQSEGYVAKYLVATVKGDVHDIGKNIAAVILRCNGFEVIDMGVMVSPQDIAAAAVEHSVDFVALSGLITPSLEQMTATAVALAERGVSVPLFISGATTSALHTAVKIAPHYGGAVFHIKDASQNPVLALKLLSEERLQMIDTLKEQQQQLREQFESVDNKGTQQLPRVVIDFSSEKLHRAEANIECNLATTTVATVAKYINWRSFHHFWRTTPYTKQGRAMRAEAERVLELFAAHTLRGRAVACNAYSDGDSIVVQSGENTITIPTPRQRRVGAEGVALALADFVAPKQYDDQICLFALTVPQGLVAAIEEFKRVGDDYNALLYQSVADRVVEAASEYLHRQMRFEWLHRWSAEAAKACAEERALSLQQLFAAKYRGIRPAVGYSCLPEQKNIFKIDKILHLESLGISLTESGAMYPQSSVCGIYIGNSHAKYFIVE